MKIEKFHLYLADLNPRMGTEPGKVRPVVVVQTDLLNGTHPSTVICPTTTRIVKEAEILRVHLPPREAGLEKPSDILVDQIRAVDNRRLIRHIGPIASVSREKLLENLRIILFE